MQCALGIGQLARIETILARRQAIARHYCDLLSGDPDLALSATDVPNQRLSWFVFVVRLAQRFSQSDRDRIMRDLAEAGIATGRYFAPIHLQPAYAEWRGTTSLPVTESVAARTLAVPFFNRITDEQIERVCRELKAALRRKS
jgi:perosamine synthetase